MALSVCGLYVLFSDHGYPRRRYLPQISLESHTTIFPSHQSTKLTQIFTNPTTVHQERVSYAFPLFDGVTVTSFRCTIDDRTIEGLVQEKQRARQTFNAAVQAGQTAALIENLPAGIFGLSVGNIPAASNITVEVTYTGELKHDAEIDGLRFNLPMSIAPRYGSYGETFPLSNNVRNRGIQLSVDTQLGRNRIQSITTTSAAYKPYLRTLTKSDQPDVATGARVSLDGTEMVEDFVLLVKAGGLAEPQALQVQTSSHIAVMATFVPKFKLPFIDPELIFIADQSGSMQGASNESLKAALSVFIKSLPANVHFNICDFGSAFRYLFDKSKPYTKDTANEALKYVQRFDARLGGTEMQAPVEEAFRRRLKDRPMEIIVLTDGEIWGEDELFNFINEQRGGNDIDARVFCLGIGGGVSHTLVEGLARAGNGASQFVTANENLDLKIIRMLKAALSPHLKNVKLELVGDDMSQDDDDYEMVSSAVDPKSDSQAPGSTTMVTQGTVNDTTSTSLFDENADLDSAIPNSDPDTVANLQNIVNPDQFTAPLGSIPLHPFNRTTLYAVRRSTLSTPHSVKISATYVDPRSKEPKSIDLDIPISQAVRGDESILKMAARRAIQELEEGRGWLPDYIPPGHGKPMRSMFNTSEQYDKLVERACIDLGVKHQVSSKFTSYVAVDRSNKSVAEEPSMADPLVHEVSSVRLCPLPAPPPLPPAAAPARAPMMYTRLGAPASSALRSQPPGLLVGGGAMPQVASSLTSRASRSYPYAPGGSVSGSTIPSGGRFGSPFSTSATVESGLLRSPSATSSTSSPTTSLVTRSAKKKSLPLQRQSAKVAQAESESRKQLDLTSPAAQLRALIDAQDFDGSWTLSESVRDVLVVMGIDIDEEKLSKTSQTTVYIRLLLQKRFAALEEVWELIADKADAWIDANVRDVHRGDYERKAMVMLES